MAETIQNNELGKIDIPANRLLSNESFRTLRTNLLYSSDTHCITITSSSPDEGKTVISFNLALSFAQLGKKTLLVDADLKRSSLSQFLNISRHTSGLSEVLTNQADLRIIKTNVENLYILPSGAMPINSTELLSSQLFTPLMDLLKEYYDYIIVDTPPFAVSNDAMIATKATDGAIIVVRNQCTRKKEIQRIKEMYDRNNARLIGFVLNRVKKNQIDYSNYEYYKNYYYYYY